MLRAILVDDEQPALDLLGIMIREQTEFRILGAYENAFEGLAATERLQPDVVFLDISMPGMNGLEFGARLLESCPQTFVVYVTAYSEYALQAFQVNSVDYLLKPYRADDIRRTAAKLMRRRAVAEPQSSGGGRIECFGGFAVYADRKRDPIRFPTLKTEELLAFLIVRGREEAGKWEICDSLWPDCASARAEQNLHTTAHRLKRTLAEHAIGVQIESRRGSYRVVVGDICDFTAFEAAAIKLEDARSDRFIAEATQVVSICRGELFAGKDYVWCEVERTATLRRYAGIAKRLAGQLASSGADGDRKAVDLLRKLLSRSALDEEAHDMLLQAYGRLGDRVSFLAHYEQMEQLFRTELGLEPRADTMKLYERVIGC